MGEHPSCNVIDCCRFDKRGSHDCGRREMSGGPSREKREREKERKKERDWKGEEKTRCIREDDYFRVLSFVLLSSNKPSVS
ncbi:hypothetical protein AVEN_206481-1 [Araneus ventricosus]|uniref:Uncharacterized protein n=1 Tax=Araneus ventricosus TaxID=182803 RepID=A0A4Y2JH41_ARAVE|nr:hypothetical protein AVEN_228903-1 [Araneus ventricosus]GBM88788.1 hypothetical protein AVEN_234937-1 [Araneus ventricosus]GBM88914.1 hypothetical protein AVEN_90424-1 [Araneus ventricosus]GBM89034.1 hypothetical protein AVEN_206481-1 [Araneus ventricosus]